MNDVDRLIGIVDAAARLLPEEQDGFLREVCGGDAELEWKMALKFLWTGNQNVDDVGGFGKLRPSRLNRSTASTGSLPGSGRNTFTLELSGPKEARAVPRRLNHAMRELDAGSITIHHRDTEDTEGARSFFVISSVLPPCSLCLCGESFLKSTGSNLSWSDLDRRVRG